MTDISAESTLPRQVSLASLDNTRLKSAPLVVRIAVSPGHTLNHSVSAAAEGLDSILPPIVNLPVVLNNHHGAVATAAPVQLIFWGAVWNTADASPSASALIGAVQNILASPYLSGLRQYGIGPSTFRGAITVTSPGPPASPSTFNDTTIQDLVQALIDGGTFPEPDEGGHFLYFVMMPPNTIYGPGGARAAHSMGTNTVIDADHTWVAWIGNDTVDQMTSSFCHELVEMCTDPEGDAWIVENQPPPITEIGDVCNLLDQTVNGVLVEAYWSKFDNACLIPTSYSIRRTLIWAGKSLGGKGIRSLQAQIPSVKGWLRSL